MNAKPIEKSENLQSKVQAHAKDINLIIKAIEMMKPVSVDDEAAKEIFQGINYKI